MTSLSPMRPFASRSLTQAERAAVSRGLAEALERANAWPQIVARPSVPALIAASWRGRAPVMVLGQRIYWPGAAEDFSVDPWRMSVLQHELQHVLEFSTGVLTRLGYVLRPANWIYRYRIGDDSLWEDFGAEQRAQIVQEYWLAERGLLKNAPPVERFCELIPWARDDRAHIQSKRRREE